MSRLRRSRVHNKRRSSKRFSRKASKTKPINKRLSPMRGGFRI